MKNQNKKTLVLLDAHAIIHRAYHGMPDFKSTKGEPTGALYGICTMLLKIRELFDPEYIAACYDLPKATFRHELYTEYKAGRQKADEDLVYQIKRSRDVFEAFSVPMYEAEGFEADDLLGTFSHALRNEYNIIIASGDMDTMQLIDDGSVKVFTLRKSITDTVLYDEDAVFERYGFHPNQIPDYKGLAGDPSDNIPGIKGVGTKTATTLINHFGNIENMYEQIHENKDILSTIGITPRLCTIITEGEDDARFSKTIATIRLDAPVTYHHPDLHWHDSLSKEKLLSLFDELEFRSLKNKLEQILAGNAYNKADMKEEEHIVLSDEMLKRAGVMLWLLNSEYTQADSQLLVEKTGKKTEKEIIEKLESELDKIPHVHSVWKHIEEPLLSVVEDIRNRGIKIDVPYFHSLSKELHKRVSHLEKEIYTDAGREFNVASPKQLGEILFDELKLTAPGLKKTSTGKRSTNSDTLEKLREIHPIIEKIITYRELQKLLSTYIDTLPTLVDSESKIHPNLLQAGTTTGRFSSAEPNLQNIPTEEGEFKNVRKGFIPSDGYIFMSCDYSQIELRIAAMMSRDANMLDIFARGDDIHASVAQKVFNVDKKDVTHEMRRKAKVINFGILYGMGIVALRQNLGTDREAAKEFYDVYKQTFSTLAGYLDFVVAHAKRLGYTETAFGRRRQIPLLGSKLPMLVAQGERMAINAPIQGTATADIVRLAMIDVEKNIKEHKLENEMRLLLQIHDELLFEVKKGSEKKAEHIIRSAMEDVLHRHAHLLLEKYDIPPTPVTCKVGDNWGEMKEV